MKKLFAWDDKKSFKKLVKSTPALWLFATVFYGLLTTLLMGTAITACGTTIFGYPGDGSGGIGWFQWADPGIRWYFTEMSNYPFGEPLNRPQFITSYALFIPFSLLSLLTNQTCGQNIMVFIGFLSTALVMFGLVRWLIKNNLIALFAGFGAAYVPFHYSQAQGHQAYVFASIFGAIIWAFLWFMQKPNSKRIALVALLYATSFYMDGYFILISTLLVATMFLVYILQGALPVKKAQGARWVRFNAKRVWENLTKNRWIIVAAIAITGLLLTPIIYKQLKSGAEIQQTLSMQRADIQEEAQTYGVSWEDFFLPSYKSAFVGDGYASWRNTVVHGNNVENLLYIGYVIVALMLFAFVYAFTKRGKQDTYFKSFKPVLLLSIWIIIILTLFSLPPQLRFGDISIATPTQLLIDITEKWRVVSRLFMATHLAMVIIAAIGLAVISKMLPKRKSNWLIGAAFILLFIEFLPVRTFNWSYETDTPRVYKEMAKDDSVKALAEYPILDYPTSTLPYTFTFQQVHGKPMLNANGPVNNQHHLRQSIGGLADPQTLGVLRQLGVDTVTSLGIKADGLPGLRTYMPVEYTEELGNIYAYRLEDGPKRPFALVLKDGFTVKFSKDQLTTKAYLINSARLIIEPVGRDVQTTENDVFTVRFKASAHEDGAQKMVIRKNDPTGEILWQGIVQKDTMIEFQVKGAGQLFLNVPGYYNTPALYIDNYSVSRN